MMRSVTGCARWRRSGARRTRGTCPRARAPRRRRRRARRRIDAPGGGDARALQDAERAAEAGRRRASGGSRYAFASTRSFRSAEDVSEGVGVAGSGILARRERQRERLEATTLRLDVRVRLLPGGLAEQAKQLARVRHGDVDRARSQTTIRAADSATRRRWARGVHVELRTLSSARIWAQVVRRVITRLSGASRRTTASHPSTRPLRDVGRATSHSGALASVPGTEVSPRGVSGDAARRSPPVVPIAVALGSNQGDRVEIFREALRRLAAAGLTVTRHSSLYETAPAYVTDQPAFLNAAAVVRAEDPALASDPLALLDALKTIERDLGRVEGGLRFGPRPIDLDVIFHERGAHACERLEVPHRPRFAERGFVLAPLADLHAGVGAPAIDHPAVAARTRRRALPLARLRRRIEVGTPEMRRVMPLGDDLVTWGDRAKLMGVLNVTPIRSATEARCDVNDARRRP